MCVCVCVCVFCLSIVKTVAVLETGAKLGSVTLLYAQSRLLLHASSDMERSAG